MHTKHAVVLSYTDTTALFPSDVSTVSAPEYAVCPSIRSTRDAVSTNSTTVI